MLRVASVRRPVLRVLLFAALVAGAVCLPARAAGPDVTLQPSAAGDQLVLAVGDALAWDETDGAFSPTLAGFGRLGVTAAPDLLARRERVALDPGTVLVLEGADVDWAEGVLPGPLAPFPARDPRRAPIADAIANGGWWPAQPVRLVSNDGALRTLRYAELEIAPVQVDLATGRFRVLRRAVLHLARRGGSDASTAALAPGARLAAGDAASALLDDSVALGASGVRRGAPVPAAAAPLAPDAAPTFPAWQIEVDQTGIYRLPYAWVQANLPGLIGNDPRRFRLTVQGVEVPIAVEGEADGSFDPADAIVFYGQRVQNVDLYAPDTWEHGDFSATNVYRLDLATGPLRVAAAPNTRSAASGYPVQPSFRTTAHHEEDVNFLGLLPADGVDHWYASPFLVADCVDTSHATCADPLPGANCNNSCANPAVCCAGTLDQVVDTPGHAGGSVDVRVRLIGIGTVKNPTAAHRSEILVDGVSRDTNDWNGNVEHTHAFTQAGALSAATHVKTRFPLGRAGVYGDAGGYNWVEVDYDRNYAAVADTLAFALDNANRDVRVTALSALPRIWDLNDTVTSAAGMTIVRPREVQGVQFGSGQARFEIDQQAGAPTARRFAAATNAGMFSAAKAGRQDQPPSAIDASLGSSLKGAGLGADWLVIGAKSVLDTTPGSSFMRLVGWRQGQGLRTAIVDVRDVFDEFTDGIEDPQALHDFLAWTLAHWSPAPSYVVLVGDATRDYKNNYGWSPRRQFVPTYMADLSSNSQFGYYLSDAWFAAVVGNDALPDTMIGRLPVHSAAEAAGVFDKIYFYEKNAPYPATWAGKAMLVSENDGPDFIAEHDTIYGRYFTSGPQTATKVYETLPGADCNPAANDERARIKTAVNAGAALTSFAGHGGYKNWARDCTFFNSDNPAADDIDTLTNGGMLQFHVHANCITGHFSQDNVQGTTNDMQYTFLEDWITTPNKGAVAGIAPAHLSYSFLLDAVLDPAYSAIFGKRKERVAGVIDLRIRQNLATLNDTVSVQSFVLEGDPATRLAIPAPPAPSITSIDRGASGTLTVKWTAVTLPAGGTPRYRVYRSAYPGGPYTLLGTVTTLSLTDSGLTNCQEYFYYVVSVDLDGFESRWSNFNETCYGNRSDCRSNSPQNPNPPAPVTGVTVTDTQEGGTLRVQWSTAGQAADVVQYRVSWGTAAAGPFPSNVVTAAPGNVALIGGLNNKSTYWVVVRAEHCSLAGPDSAAVSGVPHLVRGINPPDAISDLRVSKSGANLKLDWTVPSQSVWGTATAVTSVEVYSDNLNPRFATDLAHRRAQLTIAPMNTWPDAGANSSGNGNRFYLVTAVDSGGLRSAAGDQLPDGIPDLKLRRFKATAQVELSWSTLRQDLNGRPMTIKDYNVYGQPTAFPRSACTAGNRVVTATTATTVLVAEPAGASYFWQVLGEDSHGSEAVW